jgi:hypothetical protein
MSSKRSAGRHCFRNIGKTHFLLTAHAKLNRQAGVGMSAIRRLFLGLIILGDFIAFHHFTGRNSRHGC